LHPRSRKTPRGGRMMARRILQMSLAVKGMMDVRLLVGMEYVKGTCCGVVVG
jgi:hypothetical protein